MWWEVILLLGKSSSPLLFDSKVNSFCSPSEIISSLSAANVTRRSRLDAGSSSSGACGSSGGSSGGSPVSN
jgi:hypothetical protein